MDGLEETEGTGGSDETRIGGMGGSGGSEETRDGRIGVERRGKKVSGYHRSKTNSEQKPGPRAPRMLQVPGSGRRRVMNSSRTTRTEAEERLPTLRRHCQEASSAWSARPRASRATSKP